jgi:hypothetical protein
VNEELYKIEKLLDEKVSNLSIWSLSFQKIITILLYNIETITRKLGKETSMDYTGRLSYIYPIIKKYAKNNELESTTNALTSIKTNFLNDIIFLTSYAHLCLLIPQVRKGTLKVESINGNTFNLIFTTPQVEFSEKIDRIYSYSSLQVSFDYESLNKLPPYIKKKIEDLQFNLNSQDFIIIQDIYTFYIEYHYFVKPTSDVSFEEYFKFSYSEYNSFCAAIRAFSEYFLALNNEYFKAANQNRNNEKLADKLMSEHFEWAVCCIDYKFLGWIKGMTNLPYDKLLKITGYYISVQVQNDKEIIEEHSYCGDGYFPPLILNNQNLIFSPRGCKYMLNINNILYSENKCNKKKFDDYLSKEFEPNLINQVVLLFGKFPELKIFTNCVYKNGEIDIVVIDDKKGFVLNFQVKATIAPDSSRSVERVSDRVIEAFSQIEAFNKLEVDYKNSFYEKLLKHKFLVKKTNSIVLVRSCAGTEKSWRHNEKNPIVNYILLYWILSNKLKSNQLSIEFFEEEVYAAQDYFMKISNPQTLFEELEIDEFRINFPNIEIDSKELNITYIKSETE